MKIDILFFGFYKREESFLIRFKFDIFKLNVISLSIKYGKFL